MNFEVYVAARPLTLEEFVSLCGIDGEVVVRTRGYLTEGHWETVALNVPAEEAPEAYSQIAEAGFELVMLPTLLTEDEFVTLAAARGSIDLMRVRGDGRVVRYFGTQIGRSNIPEDEALENKSFSAFTEAIEGLDLTGLE